jgi:hypothetical protein
MEIGLVLLYTVIFCLIILRWKWFKDVEISGYLFVFLFIIKVSTGIFAGDLYLKRYAGGDSHAFFRDAQVIVQSLHSNPGDYINMILGTADEGRFIEKYGIINTWNNEDVVYNDNRTVIRLNALIGLISGGIYNVHVVFFAFISMLGLMGIFKATRLVTTQNPYLLFAAIFLIPGVLFWFSLASKESILIFALGMLLYHCIRLLTVSRSAGNMLGMFLAGYLFIHIKAYVLVLITPCLLAFTWVHVTGNRLALLKYLIIYTVLGVLLFNLKYLMNGFDPVNIVFMKRMNFEAFADLVPKDMSSYITIPDISSDWLSILKASPLAISVVFMRPYLWESESLLITFAAIENILLILMVAIGFIYFSFVTMMRNINLLLFCIFFVLTVYLLIGITTPVMGAMVRYKVPALPFLALLPILLSGIGNNKPGTNRVSIHEDINSQDENQPNQIG